MPDQADDVVRLRRQAVLLGCALAVVAFAIQFAVDLLWPDAVFAAMLVALYLAVKVVGDRLVAGLCPQAPRMRPDQEWGRWLRLAIPVALLQAVLVGFGAVAIRSIAAAVPCALFVADIGWLRTALLPEPDADSLGRRLATWP